MALSRKNSDDMEIMENPIERSQQYKEAVLQHMMEGINTAANPPPKNLASRVGAGGSGKVKVLPDRKAKRSIGKFALKDEEEDKDYSGEDDEDEEDDDSDDSFIDDDEDDPELVDLSSGTEVEQETTPKKKKAASPVAAVDSSSESEGEKKNIPRKNAPKKKKNAAADDGNGGIEAAPPIASGSGNLKKKKTPKIPQSDATDEEDGSTVDSVAVASGSGGRKKQVQKGKSSVGEEKKRSCKRKLNFDQATQDAVIAAAVAAAVKSVSSGSGGGVKQTQKRKHSSSVIAPAAAAVVSKMKKKKEDVMNSFPRAKGVNMDLSDLKNEAILEKSGFKCILGDDWEVRIDPMFASGQYISIRKWEDGAKVGPGATLKVGFIPKLYKALVAAAEYMEYNVDN